MAIRNIVTRLGYAALKAGVRAPKLSKAARFSEQAYLRDLLKGQRINCVLDVGANKGWFSKHLRMMGFVGEIFSFEPVREDYQTICELAKDDPLWHVFDFAIGSENEIKKFNVISMGSETVFSSFLTPQEDLKGVEISRVDSIVIKKLDDILGEMISHIEEPRIFLKVDTQGFDIEVIKGVEANINKIQVLQSEISVRPIYGNMPHYTKALVYYESLGFSLMNLFIVNRTPEKSILEYDCIMARVNASTP